MKCSKWKLAIITELINGNNGLVRAAKIRMNEIETTRPIVKIYPLEVTMNTFHKKKVLVMNNHQIIDPNVQLILKLVKILETG